MPVVSAITDLAALRYWAHPGVDLHLITHPESDEEVRAIAPASAIECVRGLTDPGFYEPPRPRPTRGARWACPPTARSSLVSGGGWAVGDLAGAAEVALAAPDATVVVPVRPQRGGAPGARRRFAGDERVVVLGLHRSHGGADGRRRRARPLDRRA